MECCVGIYDIWPEAQYYLSHLIPKPGSGYSLATIIGAVLASLLLLGVTAGTILLITNVYYQPPVCPCPILDYGLVSWVGALAEGFLTPSQDEWLLPGPGVRPPLAIYSTTSNSSKFDIAIPRAAGNTVGYTPVFAGPSVKISGTMTISFVIGTPNAVDIITIRAATAWTLDRTTFNNMSEGSFNIVSPTQPATGGPAGTVPPNSGGSITLPFAVTFTPSQLPTGSVGLVMLYQIHVPVGTATVQYKTTTLSLLVNELS